MWGALLTSAAANKAASLGVGLSVLIGGAGAAEVTGIGPQVSAIVRPPAPSPADSSLKVVDSSLADETLDAAPSEETETELDQEESNAVDETNGGEHHVVASDEVPGNLVWHQKDDTFHLRGVLVGSDGTISVRTAGPDGEPVDLTVTTEGLDLRVPGSRGRDGGDPPTLEDLVGHLVTASGVCTEEPTPTSADTAEANLELTEGAEPSEETQASESTEATAETAALSADSCTVTSIQVLGNAGQPGGPNSELTADAEATELASTADESSSDDPVGEAPVDQESGPNQGDERGKPDHAGGPKPKE